MTLLENIKKILEVCSIRMALLGAYSKMDAFQ